MKRVILMSIMICFVGIASVYGKIYSYVDETGQLWFVDNLAAVPERYRKKMKTTKTIEPRVTIQKDYKPNKIEPHAAIQKDRTTNKRDRSTRKKDVTIYVTSWCHYCTKLEGFLKKNNIAYQKVDIEKSSSGKREREFKKLGGRGVPLTKIGDQVIKGYAPESILSAYSS